MCESHPAAARPNCAACLQIRAHSTTLGCEPGLVGWGTWIRTKIHEVRVRYSSVELSTNSRVISVAYALATRDVIGQKSWRHLAHVLPAAQLASRSISTQPRRRCAEIVVVGLEFLHPSHEQGDHMVELHADQFAVRQPPRDHSAAHVEATETPSSLPATPEKSQQLSRLQTRRGGATVETPENRSQNRSIVQR